MWPHVTQLCAFAAQRNLVSRPIYNLGFNALYVICCVTNKWSSITPTSYDYPGVRCYNTRCSKISEPLTSRWYSSDISLAIWKKNILACGIRRSLRDLHDVDTINTDTEGVTEFKNTVMQGRLQGGKWTQLASNLTKGGGEIRPLTFVD